MTSSRVDWGVLLHLKIAQGARHWLMAEGWRILCNKMSNHRHWGTFTPALVDGWRM